MAGTAGDKSLEETPTWAVAAVCAVFVLISVLIEHGIHSLGHDQLACTVQLSLSKANPISSLTSKQFKSTPTVPCQIRAKTGFDARRNSCSDEGHYVYLPGDLSENAGLKDWFMEAPESLKRPRFETEAPALTNNLNLRLIVSSKTMINNYLT